MGDGENVEWLKRRINKTEQKGSEKVEKEYIYIYSLYIIV